MRSLTGRALGAAFILLCTPCILFPSAAAGENGMQTAAPDEKPGGAIKIELERLEKATDFNEWQKFFDETPELTSGDGEYEDIRQLIEDIALSPGEARGEGAAKRFKTLLLPSFSRSVKRLIGVAAAAILTGFCGIAAGDEGNGLKNTLMLVICASAALALTAVFSDITAETMNAVKKAERFTAAAEPVLMGLLTALGCQNSARLLNPALVFLSGGIISFIKTIVMPALLSCGVLTVVNGLTDRLKLANTVKLLQKAVKWMLGLLTTLYIALTAVGGINAGIADGISIRTAKYAADRLIPAVGGMVTGAVDAAIGGALLLKNAAGVVSIILIAAITLKPLAGLLGAMTALQAAAAVTEPFSDERIPKMLEGLAENVKLLFAALAAVISMFVITAVIIISTGGMLVG